MSRRSDYLPNGGYPRRVAPYQGSGPKLQPGTPLLIDGGVYALVQLVPNRYDDFCLVTPWAEREQLPRSQRVIRRSKVERVLTHEEATRLAAQEA
jgi:hypothetical protein